MDPIEPLIDLAIVTGDKCESCEIFDTNSICLLIMVDVFFTQSLILIWASGSEGGFARAILRPEREIGQGRGRGSEISK